VTHDLEFGKWAMDEGKFGGIDIIARRNDKSRPGF